MLNRAEKRAQVRRLVEEGCPNDVIADRAGVAYGTVTRWARERGWRPKPTLSPVTEKRLRLMAEKGWCCTTISKSLGIGRKVLIKLAADRGIEFATGTKPSALAAGLKLGKMKRWENKLARMSEKERAENPLDEWAWA